MDSKRYYEKLLNPNSPNRTCQNSLMDERVEWLKSSKYEFIKRTNLLNYELVKRTNLLNYELVNQP